MNETILKKFKESEGNVDIEVEGKVYNVSFTSVQQCNALSKKDEDKIIKDLVKVLKPFSKGIDVKLKIRQDLTLICKVSLSSYNQDYWDKELVFVEFQDLVLKSSNSLDKLVSKMLQQSHPAIEDYLYDDYASFYKEVMKVKEVKEFEKKVIAALKTHVHSKDLGRNEHEILSTVDFLLEC